MAIGRGQVATFAEGAWHEGNIAVMRAADHAMWLGSQVFDGARFFEGVSPDLDLHSARLIRSAEALGLMPKITGGEVAEIIEAGISRFAPNATLYLRPMMWGVDSGAGVIDIAPERVGFAVSIEELPMPAPEGFSLTVSPFRRPPADTALTEAKAASLYANNSRIMAEARGRGFSNALSLDQSGHVAETASTNAFFVRDGVVFTPLPNGTFLAGITRARVIELLREDGVEVVEGAYHVADFASADEIFVTGNIAKVMPVTRFEQRNLPFGPVTARARTLYWVYAHR